MEDLQPTTGYVPDPPFVHQTIEVLREVWNRSGLDLLDLAEHEGLGRLADTSSAGEVKKISVSDSGRGTDSVTIVRKETIEETGGVSVGASLVGQEAVSEAGSISVVLPPSPEIEDHLRLSRYALDDAFQWEALRSDAVNELRDLIKRQLYLASVVLRRKGVDRGTLNIFDGCLRTVAAESPADISNRVPTILHDL